MEKTVLKIEEYRGDQDLNFVDVTAFEVLNTGEATVDINTIPVYPGQSRILVATDGTICDFTLKAKFTEAEKLPKFKAIYKQLPQPPTVVIPAPEYAATLYSYAQGDIVDFSINKSGETVLMRSFDGGTTYDEANTIALGYVIENVRTFYDAGGSNFTTNIKFLNVDSNEISQSFLAVHTNFVADFQSFGQFAVNFTINKPGEITLHRSIDGTNWISENLGFIQKDVLIQHFFVDGPILVQVTNTTTNENSIVQNWCNNNVQTL